MSKIYVVKSLEKGQVLTGRYNQGKPYAEKKYQKAVERVKKAGIESEYVILDELNYGKPPDYKFLNRKTLKKYVNK